MTRTERQRISGWVGLVALGLIGGCGGLPGRHTTPPGHSSTSMLEPGSSPKVTKNGAADIQFALGRSQEEAGKLDEAEKAYRSALVKNPKRADIETRLAIVIDRSGDRKQADVHFEKALKLDPKNPDLRCDRGYCFYLRGQNTEAEKSLRAALALAPQHARSHTNLGLVLAARGDSAGAVAEFGRAGTDPADSRSNLALALALDGKVEAARDQYAQALAAKPGSPTATQGLKIAATVLKKNAAKATTDLPHLPGDPAPATVASAAPQPSTTMQVDRNVIPTSLTR